MRRPSRDILLGFVLICLLAISLMSSNLLRWADLSVYDAQTRWLRTRAPSILAQDVVVIGLDEAAYESIAEPHALWHRHLGELFAGLAEAKPAVVGLATPLPVRSYDFLIKGIDAPLIDGLKRLRAAAPLVVGQPVGIGRRLRPVAPELLAAAGGTTGSLAICEDSDGTVRRIFQRRCLTEDKTEPFAHVMARQMGREGAPGGLIDFSAGGEIEYLPVRDVLAWIRQGQHEQLRSRMQGRAVVVASLLPTEVRHRLPVELAAWERGSRTEPGAVAHVQALRSLLSRGLIERVADSMELLLAACGALLWFGRNGWLKLTALLGASGAVLAGSTHALWQGRYLHTGTLLAVILMAFLARLTWESTRHYREKQLLRSAFAGHVSPQVMRAILGGDLQPDADGERCQVTILFADIHGFKARSENATAEVMIALLNRYYAEVSAAIHSHGGAIDKFIGDGLTATFGVPQPLPAPQRNALEAAQDMLVRLARLNTELVAEGLAPLEIGVGIHGGEVLAGYVGSRTRRDFTVIGDPVNIAARLENMSKTTGYPVICSQDVAASVGFAGGMVDLGVEDSEGHPGLHLWGWNPPLVKLVGKATT